ncbi:MAG TPA: YibE/F family protein [Candidatus Acidoferrales bacterium]|nr:YibE/F family protein [Candidatus Acidoferrales bacterium]
MMKSGIVALIFFVLSILFAPLSFAATPTPTPAKLPKAPATPTETYETAKVLSVLTQGERTMGGKKVPYQKLQLQILDGSDTGKTLTLTYGDLVELRPELEVTQGATVVLMKSVTPQKATYEIVDTYRLYNLYPIAILFLIVVLLVTRLKGLGSLIGLAISLAIILLFIVPQILAGQDPLLASIVGSMFIMVATMYLAHGFSQKTNIALISTSLSLVLTGILSYVAVHYTFLSGLGSEDAASLQFGQTGTINFQGLLLGGIIIGSLGVLEDITTGLAASIQELTRANSRLKFRELISSGMRIGSEHIAALVNTLVLAYAGVGLPIFLFLVLNPNHQPLWYIINSEFIMEEIVRTLAGSIGLILAVPFTAVFAAWAFHQKTR